MFLLKCLLKNIFVVLLSGVDTLADGFASLAVDLHIPTSLQEVGINQGHLSLLASEAIKVRKKICDSLEP
jgi:alcohol dehydrogenase class IV